MTTKYSLLTVFLIGVSLATYYFSIDKPVNDSQTIIADNNQGAAETSILKRSMRENLSGDKSQSLAESKSVEAIEDKAVKLDKAIQETTEEQALALFSDLAESHYYYHLALQKQARLFELKPTAENLSRLQALSDTAYQQAMLSLDAGDEVSAADYLASVLVAMIRAADQQVSLDNLPETKMLQQTYLSITQSDTYYDDMLDRAERRFNSADEFDRAYAFKDYQKVLSSGHTVYSRDDLLLNNYKKSLPHYLNILEKGVALKELKQTLVNFNYEIEDEALQTSINYYHELINDL